MASITGFRVCPLPAKVCLSEQRPTLHLSLPFTAGASNLRVTESSALPPSAQDVIDSPSIAPIGISRPSPIPVAPPRLSAEKPTLVSYRSSSDMAFRSLATPSAASTRRRVLYSLTATRFSGACRTALNCMRSRMKPTHTASRSLHSSTPVLSPSPSDHIPTSTTSATTPITSIAKQGSNQLSLEQPQNKAGACPAFH